MGRKLTGPQSVWLKEAFYCAGGKKYPDRRKPVFEFLEFCSSEAAIAQAVTMSVIREVTDTWNEDEPHLSG